MKVSKCILLKSCLVIFATFCTCEKCDNPKYHQGIFPVPYTDCTQYFKCVANNGKWTSYFQSCPRGSRVNPRIQECTLDLNSIDLSNCDLETDLSITTAPSTREKRFFKVKLPKISFGINKGWGRPPPPPPPPPNMMGWGWGRPPPPPPPPPPMKGWGSKTTRPPNQFVSSDHRCIPYDTTGAYIVLDSSCTQYFKCIVINHRKEYYVNTCPKGSLFNPTKQQCMLNYIPLDWSKCEPEAPPGTPTTTTTTTLAPATTVTTTATTPEPPKTTTAATTPEPPKTTTAATTPEPPKTTTTATTPEPTTLTTTSKPTTTSTTPTPDYKNITCKPGETLLETVGSGSYLYTIDRVNENSKFVYVGRPGTVYNTFDVVQAECAKWGLELAQIKTPLGLQNIVKFMKRYKNWDTSFWISGTDEGHEGQWKYTPDNKEDFDYQAFWGFSPKSFETVGRCTSSNDKANVTADKLMLHWTDDQTLGGKTLAMMDIEGDNEYCQKKGFICQFSQSHECFTQSEEEKALQEIREKKDKLEPLIDFGDGVEIFVSNLQKTLEDAKKLCESLGKTVLDMRLTKQQSYKLHAGIQKWLKSNGQAGGTTAFWVGPSYFFTQSCEVTWDWITNAILDPWIDPVLTCGNKDNPRAGKCRLSGKCLAIGTLQKEHKMFHLQRVPCNLPQWVLCAQMKTIEPPKPPDDLTEICIAKFNATQTIDIGDVEVTDGNFTIKQIHNSSKFLYFTIPPSVELTFDVASQQCGKWGLELAQIRSHHEHQTLVKYLKSLKSWDVTFWVSGADAGQDGHWKYTPDLDNDFLHQVFWGFSSKSLETSATSLSKADRVMLHWTEDAFCKTRTLAMMDVERDNTFYEDMSFICQFKEGSACHDNSDEVKTLMELISKKDEQEKLMDFGGGLEVYVSHFQLNFEDAKQYCGNSGKSVLDFRVTKRQSEKLFTELQKWMKANDLCGGTTGFWLGPNELFRPACITCEIKWNWVNNVILDPWTDPVLKYKDKCPRQGHDEYFGKCLAIGTLQKDIKTFHLQKVPCGLPQWVICTTSNETMMETTTTTTLKPPTTVSLSKLCNEEFLQNNGKTIWRKEKVQDGNGNYTIEKVGESSKYVFFSIPPSVDLSYERAVDECRKWGLDIAAIKSQFDHRSIVKYLKSLKKQFIKDATTFWVSGTDAGQEGVWMYSSAIEEGFYYHVFWGLTSRGCKTSDDSTSHTDNIMLHWAKDTLTKQKTLVMMDVEGENSFYTRKSFMCEFEVSSLCFQHSDEEKEFVKLQLRQDELELLIDVGGGIKISISVIPTPLTEAFELCETNGQKLLDTRRLNKSQVNKLFNAWQKWIKTNDLIGAVTGFWLGPNNFFQPMCDFQWDWIDNVILEPWSDPVLQFNSTKVRKGNCQMCGKCLVLATLYKEPKFFHLQKTSCTSPQWVLCSPSNETETTTVKPPEHTTEEHGHWTTMDPHTDEPTTPEIEETTTPEPPDPEEEPPSDSKEEPPPDSKEEPPPDPEEEPEPPPDPEEEPEPE